MVHPEKHVVFGVHITDRVQHAPDVQKIFTTYGCNIKTRLGLHEADRQYCSPNGLILLEMIGEDATLDEIADKLNAMEGVEVQRMVFTH